MLNHILVDTITFFATLSSVRSRLECEANTAARVVSAVYEGFVMDEHCTPALRVSPEELAAQNWYGWIPRAEKPPALDPSGKVLMPLVETGAVVLLNLVPCAPFAKLSNIEL